jgi:ABC-2 type transport system permease protein
MKKTFIIIKREYLSRVKKRSFIIMTILGPLLMASLMIIPFFVTKLGEDVKIINVVDETGIYFGKLGSNKTIQFAYLASPIAQAKEEFVQSGSYALLYIPKPALTKPNFALLFYANKQPGIGVTSYVEERMKYTLENKTLNDQFGIDKKDLESIKTDIKLQMENMQTGENASPLLSTFIGLFAGILIYFSIFMFGSQVMRGVIEEKTSRIVEVIVSSVKPFQLLVGKITGIGLVGLTQFLLWIVLTLGIVGIFQASVMKAPGKKMHTTQQQFTVQNNTLFPENVDQQKTTTDDDSEIFNSVIKSVSNYDFVAIILLFFFYFIFGYLIYGALFAAIGAAVDSEADTQQFMLPITIPLILSFVMAQSIIENPQGPIAFWLSVIPLTSPIVMMIRLPFGVPLSELLLSMGLLLLGFLGAAWMAAKIYRTGILMYGKKISYREIWKWLKY